MAKKLEVVITGDAQGLGRAFGDAESRAGGFEGKMKGVSGRIGSSFAGIARSASLGVAGGVAILGAYAPTLVDLAGKAESWRIKTDTVFEGSAQSVRDWAKSNNEAFGVSDEQLAGMAANFGDLMKPMGFTADQAADMSKKVVGLSGALSEWSGGTRSTAEVSEILAKAMLGERDALKDLGISISEQDVQARLAAKGQDKLTGSALEQAEALATQELIFEKSTDAQKAFADGGNKTMRAGNKLKAMWGDTQVMLAEKVVPALTDVATWIGDRLPGWIARGREALATISSWWKGDGEDIKTRAETIFGRVQEIVATVVEFIRTNWPQIRDAFASVFGSIRGIIESVVNVVQTLWRNFGDDILALAQKVFPNLLTQWQNLWAMISGIFQAVAALLRGDWSELWEKVKGIMSAAWEFIQAGMENAVTILGTVMDGLKNLLVTIWSGLWGKAKELAAWGLQWVLDELKKMPSRVADATKGMFDGIKTAFRIALNWIIGKWNALDFTLPSAEVFGQKVGGWTIGSVDLPTFHTGGTVPGRMGQEVPIMALAGERVLSVPEAQAYRGPTRNAMASGGGGGVIVIPVHIGGREIDRIVVDSANRTTRATGRAPLIGTYNSLVQR